MSHKNATAIIMILTALASGPAFADGIYKSTDEEGNVLYGDRPTGDASEERLAITSKPTDPQKIQEQILARREARAAIDKLAAEEPAGPSEDELLAQAKEREEKCATYKARLQRFLVSRRLYREDENGERVYLDEDETLAARERVQNQVEEYCSP
jgi:hypothetical protein